MCFAIDRSEFRARRLSGVVIMDFTQRRGGRRETEMNSRLGFSVVGEGRARDRPVTRRFQRPPGTHEPHRHHVERHWFD